MRDARDKVHRPLFRRHVRRPRLTVLLDEATAQSIILTAPAGYGKTTLAREWLQGREHAAWYRATPASADVGAFSAGLAEAVGPVVPGAGERVRQRLRVGDATERLARPLAELLAEDLEAWPVGGIIVLDDYHLLAESGPVEIFLDWLLTLAPIRVLVTTRRRPGWATARRFTYGEAFEIGRDQLAMTPEEATRVLEGRSTEAVHALVRQADGWPAVIGLAALSAELAFPKERASESLYRYFAEEVLRAEPAAVQRLMLAAAVPSSITVRLAEDVLGLRRPRAGPPPASRRGPAPRDPDGRARLPPAHPGLPPPPPRGRRPRAPRRPPPPGGRRRADARPLGGGVRALPPGRPPGGGRRDRRLLRPQRSWRTARARRWRSGWPPAAPPASPSRAPPSPARSS